MTKEITSDMVRSLPEEMLSEILTHVASNSITDFVNTKLSCKAFFGASNYDHIFENVSMEKLGFVPWRKSEKLFQKRCKAANNVEALYRKGMVDFFSRRKPESGLHCLKKATGKGHVEARYTYGIILICFGGKLREQGLRVVKSLNLVNSNKRSSRIIASCRSKTDKFFSCMWVHFALAGPKRISCNCDRDIRKRSNCSNSSDDQAWEARNTLSSSCDSCFWDHEATLFCSLLRKYVCS